MKSVDYAGMFVKEFHEALEENPTAWVPIGLLEFHGDHLALGCDFLNAYGLCRLLAETYGGIVLPPSYFGAQGFSSYEGTIEFPSDLASALLTALLQQLEKVRFKTAIILSGHGGSVQDKMVAKAVEDYEKEGSVRVIVLRPGAIVGPSGEWPPHATARETALLQALYPEAVDVSRFVPGKEFKIAYQVPRYKRESWQIGEVDIREQPLAAMAKDYLERLVKGVGELLNPASMPNRE
ncbi:MAG: creatininase family protein [Armatimonadetes bacterium]|nr:creatininase family protein [Armatimonadota bacterium]